MTHILQPAGGSKEKSGESDGEDKSGEGVSDEAMSEEEDTKSVRCIVACEIASFFFD